MKQGVVIATCVAYAVYCLFQASAGASTSPDSAFYLSFSPIYPTGYPLFLWIVGERGAVIVQPLLYSAALVWLGLETLKLSSSAALSLAVIAAAVAVPGLVGFHASILTESLFMSCEVALLAAMMRFNRRPTILCGAVAGTIAGLSATVRNAGDAFLPVLLVMVLISWRRLTSSRQAMLMAVALPIVVLVAAERFVAWSVNGDRTTSLFGRHMFAKAALIEAPRAGPPLGPARTVIEDYLQTSFAPIRQTIAAAPPSLRGLLTVYYETCLHGPCALEMREAALAGQSESEQNSLLARVALDRIVRAPVNFALLTARHYSSLWTAYKQQHPDTTPVLNDFFVSHRPLPFEELAFSWRDPERVLQFEADERVRWIQPVVTAMAWGTGALALLGLGYGFARRSPSPPLAVAVLSALTAHAVLLFSATFAAGLSRFTVSVWPAVMTSLLSGFWAVAHAREKGLRDTSV